MVGKSGRSGRPLIGGPKVAVQIRLSAEEAEALKRLVEDKMNEVTAAGGSASNASVMRALVRKALISEGYLKDTPETRKGRK